MSYFRVENLSLIIDKKKLLDNISFSIKKGSICLIAGKNGSGKSLLLKCLKGLERPENGSRILIDGKEMKKAKERMLKLSLVFQDTSLEIVGSTVEKDIAFGPENLGLERKEIDKKVEQMLNLFEMEKIRNSQPEILSGGERRKLCIAGVIAMDPDVLLLDEPFANLDYPSTLTVIKTLIKLKEKGITIVIVSHEAEKFLFHTDHVIILKDGKIVYDGTSRESLKDLRKHDIYIPKNARFEDLTWLE